MRRCEPCDDNRLSAREKIQLLDVAVVCVVVIHVNDDDDDDKDDGWPVFVPGVCHCLYRGCLRDVYSLASTTLDHLQFISLQFSVKSTVRPSTTAAATSATTSIWRRSPSDVGRTDGRTDGPRDALAAASFLRLRTRFSDDENRVGCGGCSCREGGMEDDGESAPDEAGNTAHPYGDRCLGTVQRSAAAAARATL